MSRRLILAFGLACGVAGTAGATPSHAPRATTIASAGDAPTVTPPTTPTTPATPPTGATTGPATTGPATSTTGSTGGGTVPGSTGGSTGSTTGSTTGATTSTTGSTTAAPSSGTSSAPTKTASTDGGETSTTAPGPEAPPDLSDQAIGAEIGASSGGRDTPGGLRVAGHYLYQLAAQDWFDGLAAFTFGGGHAACFRDRMDVYLCDHGIADGGSIEIAATVRHFFGSTTVGGKSGEFWPFLLGGVGIRVDRFSADDVTGLAIPFHLGAGMRVSITSSVAITAQGALEIGFGAFNHTLGLEPQFGAALTAGAEFRL